MPRESTDLSINAFDPDLQPQSIPHSTSESSALIANDASAEQSLLEPYARFRTAPLAALQELGLHFLGEGWRSYDQIVGQEIFYPGFSERMKSDVLKQQNLRDTISRLASERVRVEVDEELIAKHGQDTRKDEIAQMLLDVATEWTDGMICKMESRYFIRSAYYLCTQLLTRAYHQGIHVNADEVLRLRRVAEEAGRKNQSIIFLPCHRSHVDYVSLQLICYRLGLALPTVVAGDNLNFPLIGPFLQHAGAMWIRRSFGDDVLYTALVQAYMDTLLQRGHNFECFVEGGRSRTGKLLQPKFGILRFLLEGVLSGRVDDALVCPVSTQYDKVIEVDSYVSELLGQPKAKEGLWGFLGAADVLSLRLGRVDVRFQEPWSLREFVQAERGQLVARGVDLGGEEGLRRRLLQILGYRVLEDINKVSVVMPTALVGTVLLTLRGSRGVGKSELVRRVDWLCDRVRAAGGRVAHFAGSSTSTVVERALDVLGPQLVARVDGLAEETFIANERFQLSFYRNMTIHLFVSPALVCAALSSHLARLRAEPNTSKAVTTSGSLAGTPAVPYSDLYATVEFLSRLFRTEFIFPTTPLDQNLRTTIATLEREHVLTTTHTTTENNPNTTTAPAIDSLTLHPHELATARPTSTFYTALLAPFIEAAWLGAVALYLLVPPPDAAPGSSVSMPKLLSSAQLLGKTLYHQGLLSHFESVNKEALGNAFARSEEAGILAVLTAETAGGKKEKPVRLEPEWVPVENAAEGEGKLAGFLRRVGAARVDLPDGMGGEGAGMEEVWALVGRVREGIWGVEGVAGGGDGAGGPGGEGRKAGVRRRKGFEAKSVL